MRSLHVTSRRWRLRAHALSTLCTRISRLSTLQQSISIYSYTKSWQNATKKQCHLHATSVWSEIAWMPAKAAIHYSDRMYKLWASFRPWSCDLRQDRYLTLLIIDYYYYYYYYSWFTVGLGRLLVTLKRTLTSRYCFHIIIWRHNLVRSLFAGSAWILEA